MLSGCEREAVLGLADRLCLELGYGGAPNAEESGDAARRQGLVGELSREDEVLAASLRRALADLAAAVRNGAGGEERPRVVGTALEASELVIRGELLNGNSADVPVLLPSFVFLVTLPTVGQDSALELSTRTGRLVDEALRADRPAARGGRLSWPRGAHPFLLRRQHRGSRVPARLPRRDRAHPSGRGRARGARPRQRLRRRVGRRGPGAR